MSGVVAVIPIRSFTGGKTRLAGHLDDSVRAEIVRSMFEHVVATVKESGAIDRIIVVSPERDVLDHAAELDPAIVPLLQPASEPGLNAAVALGRNEAIARGAATLLILFGDLPALTPEEVRSLVRRDAPVVVATDWHGSGTNGLMLRLGSGAASEFGFAYGPDSRRRHIEEAERLGLEAVTAVAAGAAIDLDTIDDVERLLAAGRSLPGWLEPLLVRHEEKSA